MPRLSFSQRMGLTPKEFPLQVDSLDDATRMDLWNMFYQFFSEYIEQSCSIHYLEASRKRFCIYIWESVFHKDLSSLIAAEQIGKQTREFILDKKTKWFKILDFFESLLQWHETLAEFLEVKLNLIFEKNSVAYRVIGSEISPITDDQEIQAIKTAMELPDQLAGARTHISAALQLLSDREKPDYRNSIKESISAVEAVCMVLVGDESASLGKALKRLEDNGISIHHSLKNGFSSIYGYTSNKGGIRHAMIEEGTVATQEDALFMLVSCSAFCHYLQQKGAQAGLLS